MLFSVRIGPHIEHAVRRMRRRIMNDRVAASLHSEDRPMIDSFASTRRWPVTRLLVSFALVGLSACAEAPVPATSDAKTPVATTPKIDSARYQAMIVDARALIDQKRQAEAITKDLDPVIEAYDKTYGGSTVVYYSARTLSETLVYMMSSTITPNGGRPDAPGGPSAVALDQTWSGALYMKGYALVDLHRYAAAHEPLERAVRLAPSNSEYLSELGQLYLVEKNWSRALAFFAHAEQGAELSPPEVKTKELTRALRGTAYADVELGKFDEAAALYERCLALDPQDARAARELQYVHAQQAKQISRAPVSP